MMDGLEFIQATDGRQYYIESFLKTIIYGYYELVASNATYSRDEIHKKVKKIQGSEDAHNEIEDFLCTDLVTRYVKPNLRLFGLENLVVDNGVRETKENVTVGHLDIKFQVPSLSNNHYYAFEAKRLDKNSTKQKYYITGGIERFTKRTYYPETDTVVAGMVGFVEIDFVKSKKGRVELSVIKDSINKLIESYKPITTSQKLLDYELIDGIHHVINGYKFSYFSKHMRNDDNRELTIYHLFLDYYDILLN
jgi:hypothetical protein